MAIYTTRGTLSWKGEFKFGTSQNGNRWQNQDFVIDVPGHNGSITKQVIRASFDTVDELMKYKVGDKVEVSWTMYAREYNGRWFNNVELYGITAQEAARVERPAPAPRQRDMFDNSQESLDPASHPDDLPF